MDSRNLGLPMETTRFDQEWTNVDVKQMCVHLAAAICLAMTLGMSAAQLIGETSPAATPVTSSPDASSPGA